MSIRIRQPHRNPLNDHVGEERGFNFFDMTHPVSVLADLFTHEERMEMLGWQTRQRLEEFRAKQALDEGTGTRGDLNDE